MSSHGYITIHVFALSCCSASRFLFMLPCRVILCTGKANVYNYMSCCLGHIQGHVLGTEMTKSEATVAVQAGCRLHTD